MNFLDWINQGIDQVGATSSPTLDAWGLKIFLSLLVISLVWFGAQQALASAGGTGGFAMNEFIAWVVYSSFAYMMIAYYNSPMPGIGYSFHNLVLQTSSGLAHMVSGDSISDMLRLVSATQAKLGGPGIIASLMSGSLSVVYFLMQLSLTAYSVVVTGVVAYGAVGCAVVGLLGPIFIPFIIIDKLSWLFWGWLKAFIGFALYKVVATAVLSILAHLYTLYYQSLGSLSISNILQLWPVIFLLVFVNVYIMLRIPHITQSILSGSTGHGGGAGMLALAARIGI